jgi:hypothetical protein
MNLLEVRHAGIAWKRRSPNMYHNKLQVELAAIEMASVLLIRKKQRLSRRSEESRRSHHVRVKGKVIRPLASY